MHLNRVAWQCIGLVARLPSIHSTNPMLYSTNASLCRKLSVITPSKLHLIRLLDPRSPFNPPFDFTEFPLFRQSFVFFTNSLSVTPLVKTIQTDRIKRGVVDDPWIERLPFNPWKNRGETAHGPSSSTVSDILESCLHRWRTWPPHLAGFRHLNYTDTTPIHPWTIPYAGRKGRQRRSFVTNRAAVDWQRASRPWCVVVVRGRE